jgi:hypothetical protein
MTDDRGFPPTPGIEEAAKRVMRANEASPVKPLDGPRGAGELIVTLLAALLVAREYVAGELEGHLETASHLDEELKPRRETMRSEDEITAREIESDLKIVDDALLAAGMRR